MVRTFIITGDTWSSREDLKNLGGRWVPHLNAWLVPEDQCNAVEELHSIIGFSVLLVSLPTHPATTCSTGTQDPQSSLPRPGLTRPIAYRTTLGPRSPPS